MKYISYTMHTHSYTFLENPTILEEEKTHLKNASMQLANNVGWYFHIFSVANTLNYVQ